MVMAGAGSLCPSEVIQGCRASPIEGIGTESHLVRPAQFLFDEIDLEEGGQRLAIPTVGLHELLIVLAFLVPFGQQ